MHDLQHHIKTWCPVQSASKRQNTDEVKEANSELAMNDMSDNEVINKFFEESRKSNEKEWSAKVSKYVDEGMDEHEAKKKADRKMMMEDKREAIRLYKDHVMDEVKLNRSSLHQDLMRSIRDNVERGMDDTKAVRIIIASRQYLFDGLFDEEGDEEEEDDDLMEEDDSPEEMSDDE
jgi:hypothetical protein